MRLGIPSEPAMYILNSYTSGSTVVEMGQRCWGLIGDGYYEDQIEPNAAREQCRNHFTGEYGPSRAVTGKPSRDHGHGAKPDPADGAGARPAGARFDSDQDHGGA